MTILPSYVKEKDPGAELDYGIDWSDWLQTDEVIASSSWAIPTGLAAGATASSHTDTQTTVWVKSGTLGSNYDLANTIVTSAGRTDTRTLTLKIRKKQR